MQRESDVCESVCEADVLVHGCRASYLCETGRAGAQERARTSTAAVASLHPTTPSGPGTVSKAKKTAFCKGSIFSSANTGPHVHRAQCFVPSSFLEGSLVVLTDLQSSIDGQ